MSAIACARQRSMWPQRRLSIDRPESGDERPGAPILGPYREGDQAECHGHEDVPFPPAEVPGAAEGHRRERLGQQDQRAHERHGDGAVAPTRDPQVAPRGVAIEEHPRAAAGMAIGPESASAVIGVRNGSSRRTDAAPQATSRPTTPHRSSTRWRSTALACGPASGLTEAAETIAARTRPTGVAITKSGVRLGEQHPRRGQRMEAEEAGARQEGERDRGRSGRRR